MNDKLKRVFVVGTTFLLACTQQVPRVAAHQPWTLRFEAPPGWKLNSKAPSSVQFKGKEIPFPTNGQIRMSGWAIGQHHLRWRVALCEVAQESVCRIEKGERVFEVVERGGATELEITPRF